MNIPNFPLSDIASHVVPYVPDSDIITAAFVNKAWRQASAKWSPEEISSYLQKHRYVRVYVVLMTNQISEVNFLVTILCKKIEYFFNLNDDVSDKDCHAANETILFLLKKYPLAITQDNLINKMRQNITNNNALLFCQALLIYSDRKSLTNDEVYECLKICMEIPNNIAKYSMILTFLSDKKKFIQGHYTQKTEKKIRIRQALLKAEALNNYPLLQILHMLQNCKALQQWS
jgi:hypothetical protein